MDHAFTDGGITLHVTVDPGEHAPDWVTYFLARGELAGRTVEELYAASRAAADRVLVQGLSFGGGREALGAFAHEDLAPGPYTICAVLRDDVAAGCAPIQLQPAPPKQTFTVRVR